MNLRRIAEISRVFAEEGLGFLTERPKAPPGEGNDEERARAATELADAELGKRLRRTLERLGPTFVKFGQLLGTRVDLFSRELVAELAQLHSHVPPFPTPEARAILEKELGRPVDEVFAELPERRSPPPRSPRSTRRASAAGTARGSP